MEIKESFRSSQIAKEKGRRNRAGLEKEINEQRKDGERKRGGGGGSRKRNAKVRGNNYSATTALVRTISNAAEAM